MRLTLARITLLFFFTLVASGVFAIQSFFRIKEIRCTDAGASCSENITSFFTGFLGKSSFQHIDFDVPGKTGEIRVELPSRLVVTITTPRKLFSVVGATDIHYAIFSDGSVQPSQDASDSALFIHDARITDKTKSVSNEVIAFYREVREQRSLLHLTRVDVVSDTEIRLETERQLTALCTQQHIEQALRSLQLILTSPTIDHRRALVDLRFERPVLRYL